MTLKYHLFFVKFCLYLSVLISPLPCCLAVLDSAVTPGPHYSKTFLMRDGKNTLPCVFYEIVSILKCSCSKSMANNSNTKKSCENIGYSPVAVENLLAKRISIMSCYGKNLKFSSKQLLASL